MKSIVCIPPLSIATSQRCVGRGLSGIPIDANGQGSSFVQSSRLKDLFKYTNHGKSSPGDNIRMIPEKLLSAESDVRLSTETEKIVTHNLHRKFHSLIPKMEAKLEKRCDQNPRILDLRQKLNDITKRQDRNVDKTTKGLINNITQQLSDEKDQDISGPYSLLFDLQSNASTSHGSENMAEDVVWDKIKEDEKGKQEKESPDRCIEISNVTVLDRLPNVVNFDEKPMKEFEYSCEKEVTFPSKRTFNTQSRSDLCLHFKSNVQARPLEHLSPNENSSSRTNEENSLDDSLGILTPDQMDDICYLENAFSPTVEGLPMFCDGNSGSKLSPDNGDSPSTDKTESNSAASTMFMQNDLNGMASKNDCEELITPTVPAIDVIPLDSTQNVNKNEITTETHTTNPQTLENSFHTDNILISAHEVILSSSQNEKALSKDVFDIKMDELGVALIEDELLPSIHSSILEPISSMTDTTVNLELPLDCKHSENRLSVNRIEQTPSPEDLPLDSSEINGEISTYSNSQFSGSTLHDSQTFSDSKNDYQKSMETSKVSNSFITSITSITSLDGYQGDGEMSRPVSRGGDHSIGNREDIEMDWQNIPVARRTDPMTDSDFFTESDADGLDDQMHRGDRKAQVIDGALYGGKNNSNGIAPLIVNRNEDSCMESSGVYTDFENHRSSPVFLNAIDDLSPDGSSPSTHSECSQKNGNLSKINEFFSPSEEIMEDEINPIVYSGEPDTHNTCSKRNSLSNEKETRNSEKLPKEEKRSFMLKKYKMPKRDVPSKLKTILASRKTDAENSVQSSPKAVKKSDRRESVSKKNNTNEIKNDYKAKNYKDIKSKVDCSYSLQRSQTACSVTRLLSSKSVSNNMKPKSRHMRMRMELGSANGSGKSSLHSSQSDISASSTPLGKPTSRFPLMSE
ncbi:hypothetical protein EVAR_12677_1 [Eumeta japonica]|uniref:Uncharacterized protein n=1 Tax=Eumeta variegata TaxID=151549 RepID=A0A4C1YZV8_EUMVA|nr:hypothetical protein EVAR_12677_1 [Eumeta japonica]